MSTAPYTLVESDALRIGLIVLQADETIENDMRRMLPDNGECLVSRVASGTHVTPESLATMEGALQQAASLFPVGMRFDAIGYACTSGTAQIGVQGVETVIKRGTASEQVTQPVSALMSACKALNLNRIAILSPYIASVSARLHDVLDGAGINVCAFSSFGESKEANVARIAPRAIREAAIAVAGRNAPEAVFISCTNLRTLDVITEIEATTGLPVLTSNQVLAWHLLKLVGITPKEAAFGRLWSPQ